MRLLGFDITRTKKETATPSQPLSWSNMWWWPTIREPFTGAWQRNMELRPQNILAYGPVYACVTLISGDYSKCRYKLMEQIDFENDIWQEFFSAHFSPVLRKPNRYQTAVKFREQWMTSKLIHGNTYVLKGRDASRAVRQLYILDPVRTKPLVASDGSIFYQLVKDNLTGIEEDQLIVPASEIIHDTMNPLYHPLCGYSPLTACVLTAMQGLNIQVNSSKFFQNGSRPGGILTAPNTIDDVTAKRLKDYWEQNYSGDNQGKIAVLGDGLKYESMSVNAVDSQLLDQLKWTAEQICTVFHVPPYKIGVAPPPAYNNIEALNLDYYQTCLQPSIENSESLLDEGLGLTEVSGKTYGVEMDLDALLRMDTATRAKTWGDLTKSGIAKPDEGRRQFNLPTVPGGDTPYLQQQNFSLADLDERSKSGVLTAPPPPPGAPGRPPTTESDRPGGEPAEEDEDAGSDEELTRQLEQWIAAAELEAA